jgi:hypothetical protein
MDKAVLLILNQSVTITAATGLDGNGMETYGTGVVVKAIVFHKQRLVIGPQGDSVVSTAQVYVDGPTAVTTSSKITLPDGTTPLILAVSTYPDQNGDTDHKVIYT